MAKRFKPGRRSVLQGLAAVVAALPGRQAQPGRPGPPAPARPRSARWPRSEAAFLQRERRARAPRSGGGAPRPGPHHHHGRRRAKLAFVDGLDRDFERVFQADLGPVCLRRRAPPIPRRGDDAETRVLRAVVAKMATGSRFEVATGTAVAGVRSTDWIVQTEGSRTQVYVIEGAVDVADRGNSMRSLPSIAQEDKVMR